MYGSKRPSPKLGDGLLMAMRHPIIMSVTKATDTHQINKLAKLIYTLNISDDSRVLEISLNYFIHLASRFSYFLRSRVKLLWYLCTVYFVLQSNVVSNSVNQFLTEMSQR